MISVTGVIQNYILQPQLLEKHNQTINWLSVSMLWKIEINAFQKILDERAPLLSSNEEKKQMDHFQNVILYYKGEVIDDLRKQLREHEARLAKMLETKNEADTQYYKEHNEIMDKLQTFSDLFNQLRTDFLKFTKLVKG